MTATLDYRSRLVSELISSCLKAREGYRLAADLVGAMVAGRNGPERVALESFGMNLGIAFQLIDDVLDYSGGPHETGKNLGDDLAEGKPTLPLIHVMKSGNEGERRDEEVPRHLRSRHARHAQPASARDARSD